MSSVNQATIIRNLTRDTEIKHLNKGAIALNRSVATHEKYKEVEITE